MSTDSNIIGTVSDAAAVAVSMRDVIVAGIAAALGAGGRQTWPLLLEGVRRLVGARYSVELENRVTTLEAQMAVAGRVLPGLEARVAKLENKEIKP